RYVLRRAPPERLDAFFMKRIGRAHEDVVAAVFRVQSKLGSHLLEIADNVIGLLLRRAPITRRGTLYVDSVLVRARQEEGLETTLPFVTRHAIGHHHSV